MMKHKIGICNFGSPTLINFISGRRKYSIKKECLEGFTKIPDSFFEWDTNLQYIELSDNITEIGSWAFSNCDSLLAIDIPNSVTNVGDYSFQSCNNVSTLTIGSGVKNIGTRAFAYLTSLSNITYLGTIFEWNAITKEDKWNYNTSVEVVKCSDGDVIL